MSPLFPEDAPTRPIWLTTLADLSLLLVGFFVFLQANQMDGAALAASLRAGFDAPAVQIDALPVELAAVNNFAAGSAEIADAEAAIRWARAAARDPRISLTITGESEGGAADVDPWSKSPAILAADRASAVAALLIEEGAIEPERIRMETATGRRRVVLTVGFAGAGR